MTESFFLCYHNKQVKTEMRGRRYVLQSQLSENRRVVRAGKGRQGGWRRSRTPQREKSSRVSRVCRRYQGRGLLEPYRVCAQSAKPGGTAVKVVFIVPGAENLLPGRFLFPPAFGAVGGPYEKRRVSP